MNLQSSTLKWDESGEPLHIQQAKQIAVFRKAWAEAGHSREPRVSVSRSIFPLVDERERAYFGVGRQDHDQVGWIDVNTRAVLGRTYAAEPDKLVEELRQDEATAAADTPPPTIPNRWGVDYTAHVLERVVNYVAAEPGWRLSSASSAYQRAGDARPRRGSHPPPDPFAATRPRLVARGAGQALPHQRVHDQPDRDRPETAGAGSPGRPGPGARDHGGRALDRRRGRRRRHPPDEGFGSGIHLLDA